MESRTKTYITIGLLVGLLVAALDQTIVDTAFPRMVADLQGEKIVTWVLTVYLLVSTAIVPVVGKLADIYGRKIFFQAGLVFFIGGSMLCGASQSMVQLIIFRGIQGIGAGMLMPIAFTIVGDLYPGEARAKVQGLFGGVWGIASVIGPKLGGFITHHYSWRWVFYVNLPVGIIAFAIMAIAYKESRGEARPIDWMGSLAITVGIVSFMLALNRGEDWGWSSPTTLGVFAISAVMLIAFFIIETKVPEPVLDLKLFQNRTFSVMSGVGFLLGAAMLGCIFYVPWFTQGVLGMNPDQAGNITMPMMLTIVVFSILSGRLAMKISYRYQISLGFILVGIGFLLMTRWTATTTALQTTGSIMVVGAGLGLVMPILTLAMQNAFPARHRGVVTSASTFFRQIGSTVGLTALGVVYNSQLVAQYKVQVAPTMSKLLPFVSQMPPQAQDLFKQVEHSPSILVRLLTSEAARSLIPVQIQPMLFNGVKLMMVDAMHVVFWSGVGITVLGLVVVQFLGNVSLRQQAAEQGTEIHMDSPLMVE